MKAQASGKHAVGGKGGIAPPTSTNETGRSSDDRPGWEVRSWPHESSRRWGVVKSCRREIRFSKSTQLCHPLRPIALGPASPHLAPLLDALMCPAPQHAHMGFNRGLCPSSSHASSLVANSSPPHFTEMSHMCIDDMRSQYVK